MAIFLILMTGRKQKLATKLAWPNVQCYITQQDRKRKMNRTRRRNKSIRNLFHQNSIGIKNTHWACSVTKRPKLLTKRWNERYVPNKYINRKWSTYQKQNKNCLHSCVANRRHRYRTSNQVAGGTKNLASSFVSESYLSFKRLLFLDRNTPTSAAHRVWLQKLTSVPLFFFLFYFIFRSSPARKCRFLNLNINVKLFLQDIF